MKRLSVLGLLALGMSLSAAAQLNSSAPWSSGSKAQPLAPRKPSPGSDSGTPTNAPLDGGLGVLLAAGALYGRRVHKRNIAAAKAAAAL